ncbi:MAG: patatin-like phospholipase family protein, partial [Planctomyces sp.]
MRDLDKQLRSLFEPLAADWKPADKDREAAWEIHVDLRTSITTQRLHYLDGDEGAALDSLVKLFPIVRDVCRKHGSAAVVTLAVADLMLNHSLRELTASWHVRKLQGKLNPEHLKRQFRVELTRVQEQLRIISAVLHILATGRDEIPLKPGQPELPVFGPGWEYNQVLGLLPLIGDKICPLEAKEIQARRATMSAVTGKQPVTSEDPGTVGLVGLAISGGGIRSATFALGVVQVLARNGILGQVDLLSTVSGGGYTGSLLSSYLNGYAESQLEVLSEEKKKAEKKKAEENEKSNVNLPAPATGHPPFDKSVAGESRAIRYVRNHSKYMQPADLFSWAKTVGMALYGIVCNLLILGIVVLCGALFTEVLYGNALREYYQSGTSEPWSTFL